MNAGNECALRKKPAFTAILMFATLRLWGCYDNCNERLEIPRAHLRPRFSTLGHPAAVATSRNERATLSVQTRELLSTELVRIDLSAEC